ncbi:MAG: hypothetical protein HYW90_00260 [Candidatus Sungbacteria bacterium]|nr:hypothetical protein [Candidatus Sungbacteria bacterium]
MKTIFITCFQGFVSRNILSTEAFTTLANGDVRVIIFAPEKRRETLQKEFGGPNVLVEGIPVSPEREKWNERWAWVWATNLLHTRTRSIQRWSKFARDRNAFDYLFSIFAANLGRFRFVRNLYRFLADKIVTGVDFDLFFERYSPDLLFAADVYTLQDVKMMRAAKRKGVTAIGMVRSWDNVTSKTLLSHIPDYMVVNSERVKDEVSRLGDMPRDRVFAVGIPHYDRYVSSECTPRSQFLKVNNIDPQKKVILFATPGDKYLEKNPITPIVLESLKDLDVNVFVRLPVVGRDELGEYVPPKNVVFDNPGMYPNFTEAHMTKEADRHLANCLNASDIVITWASTMIVDAAIFNKPTILIGFDASPRAYHKSIGQYYDYDHHKFALESGGVRLVKSPEELKHWALRYLREPNLDEEGRGKIVKEYYGTFDRKAGKRLGEFLLEKFRN